ncbi:MULTISPECIES: DEAD/DEAH box helicase [Pseudoalteromonas]|uniref:RNA helicase n=1 Tax=Pseudoalteromonas ruthenica TaxID=151081 RepID=A0A0F4PXN4_9GAMM|nr:MULTISPECIES: DEAD/DEAH box helicase [Pseudoalteromonas]KJY99041.1 RNA helicase [Pseudoalteromonas ruthenica]KJY99916.1 RNA helicase [Pseudoalteromonas ruthenica]RZF84423.1 DEAD/DEAH box helicase [Pseudoalteromonas sp. CO325X]TMO85109.1 ATP-dependent helicase [Pseudoalteromonas ruthenica]TMO91770.1 ATP-dependent helicase [Pseudoalteromonas ruthenica]
MQFSDLGIDSRLCGQLTHQGITTPTDIQAQAIPLALAGHDLFAQSKTGSGKTLAFLLPAVQRVMKQRALSKRDPRVVIVTPTRELASQVYSQLRLLIAGTALSGTKVIGGENFNDQVKALRKNPHFVIGTPGRIADHLDGRSLQLGGLELLIFDEADRILDLGFTEQVERINAAADHRLRQSLLFSATLEHAQVGALSRNLLRNPKGVTISAATDEHSDISQHLYLADHLDHKEALLDHFIAQENVGQCIIFTATRDDTERLCNKLTAQGFKAVALAGTLAQSKRLDIMDAFSRGLYQVLVTTDVASRGLDLLNVTHVINFDLPKHAEEYIHRIGRTGRAGFKGHAISLVGPKDWQSYLAINQFMRRPLPFSEVEGLVGKFKGFTRPKPPANTKKKPQDKTKPATSKKPLAKRKKSKPMQVKVAQPAPFDPNSMGVKRKPKKNNDTESE